MWQPMFCTVSMEDPWHSYVESNFGTTDANSFILNVCDNNVKMFSFSFSFCAVYHVVPE